jgi:hypothetical protein
VPRKPGSTGDLRDMLLASFWESVAVGVVSGLLVVAISGAVAWAIKQRRRRSREPTRVKFKSTGARMSRSTDINNRFVSWDFVCPDFAVRNDGPSVLYDVEAGAEDPRGTGQRVGHPARVPRLAGEGNEHRFGNFGSHDRLDIPPEWLAGYDGQEPHKQVTYFIAATDEGGRRWEATARADPADDWVPLTFSRV